MIRVILVFRIYGLYRSKKLLYALVLLLVLAFGADTYIIVMFSLNFVDIDLGPGIGNACVPEMTQKLSFVG